MTQQLSKIFIIQVALFAASIFSISTAVFFRVSVENIKKEQISQFKTNLMLHANDFNFKVLMAQEKVKAISSRSMMREKLKDYYYGKALLEDVVKFTKPKFTDGVLVYNNILYAERRAFDGVLITEYKKSDVGEAVKNDGDLIFFNTKDGCNILIRNQIFYEGKVIGYDRAAFFLSDFRRAEEGPVKSECVKNVRIENTRISEYSSSVPIGDTGFFLYGELNQQMLKSAGRSAVKPVLFESIILFVTVIIISYFTILRLVFGLNKNLKASNRNLAEALSEKQLLFKELQHRIKNNLSFIVGYINLQSSAADSDELVQRNKQLSAKIEAISMAYKMLQTGKEISEIELGEYLKELSGNVVSTSVSEGIRIEFDIKEDFFYSSREVITVGLIFSELVVNSIKHAKGENELTILIGIEKTTAGTLLYYSDDGKPYPQGFLFEKADSLGFRIIHSLVEQLEAEIEYDFNKSKRINLTLKKYENNDQGIDGY